MKICTSLESCIVGKTPVVMTIGNFDGVHLGHQTLLKKVFHLSKKIGGSSCILTFSNHPVELFNPKVQVCRLCSVEEKVQYMAALGADAVIVLEFTHAIASQSAEVFISSVLKAVPVTHFILGYDAVIGKNRSGDKKEMERLSKIFGFNLDYIEPFYVGEMLVSSGLIRRAVQNGDFSLVERLLGRRYSLQYPIGPSMCLPPCGTYTVLLKHKQMQKGADIEIKNHEIFLGKNNINQCEIVF